MAGFNPNTWPTFQQSMPVTQGAMTGEQLLHAHLQNQMQKQQNEARPGMDAAKLAKILQYNEAQPGMDEAKHSQMVSATKGQDISNQQAPELLALKEYMSKVAAKNAEHGRQNIGLQYDKMAALYANAASRLTNNPAVQSAMGQKGDPTGILENVLSGATGFSNKFAQVSGQPSSARYNQPSPQEQTGLQQALQQAQQNRPQEQPMPEPNFPALQQYLQAQTQQSAQGGQPGMPQQQAQQGTPQSPVQPQQMPPQQQPPQTSRISPDVLEQARDATRSNQIKKNTTAQIANQMKFAGNVKALGDNIETQIPLIGKYFGIGGRAALLKDKALKNKPPEYGTYQKLANSFTLYANDLGRMMGNSSSNEQKEAMEKLVNPDFVFSNPELALSIFKGLRADETRTSKNLSQSLAQTQQQLSESDSTDQQPQAQPSKSHPPVVRAAPAGTVNMVNPKDGQVYHVKEDQAEDAIASAGWSRA